MGRWTQYDEDDYRLPEGMKREGYNADTGCYTFVASDGIWRGAPGVRFGVMKKVEAPVASSHLGHYQPARPRGAINDHTSQIPNYHFQPYRESTRANSLPIPRTRSPPSFEEHFIASSQNSHPPCCLGGENDDFHDNLPNEKEPHFQPLPCDIDEELQTLLVESQLCVRELMKECQTPLTGIQQELQPSSSGRGIRPNQSRGNTMNDSQLSGTYRSSQQ